MKRHLFQYHFTLFIVIACLGLISACGFQLKGETSLPHQLRFLQLVESNDVDFNQEIKSLLLKSDVVFSDTGIDSATLKVAIKIAPEIILAQSSSSDLQVQRLKVSLIYSLKNIKGEWLVEQKQIQQVREFESDRSQLLAKNREKSQLYQQMKKNLARILIYQLQLLNI